MASQTKGVIVTYTKTIILDASAQLQLNMQKIDNIRVFFIFDLIYAILTLSKT